jgi:hypothetical protein
MELKSFWHHFQTRKNSSKGTKRRRKRECMILTARVKMAVRVKINEDIGRNINTRRRGRKMEVNSTRNIGPDIRRRRLHQDQIIPHPDCQRMSSKQESGWIVPDIRKKQSQWAIKGCFICFTVVWILSIVFSRWVTRDNQYQ